MPTHTPWYSGTPCMLYQIHPSTSCYNGTPCIPARWYSTLAHVFYCGMKLDRTHIQGPVPSPNQSTTSQQITSSNTRSWPTAAPIYILHCSKTATTHPRRNIWECPTQTSVDTHPPDHQYCNMLRYCCTPPGGLLNTPRSH
jgi:hypothetical protein